MHDINIAILFIRRMKFRAVRICTRQPNRGHLYSFRAKEGAILCGSKGLVGGARMQSHLKQVLSSTLARIYPSPEFLVPQVQDKFDAEGRLVDADTARRFQKYISGFVIWAGRVSVL